jgi:hypothetical protein
MEGERNGDVADLTKGGMRVGFFFWEKLGACGGVRLRGERETVAPTTDILGRREYDKSFMR